MRNSHEILVGKPEAERPRRSLKINIEMDLKETGYQSLEWIHLAQGKDHWSALVDTVMNLRVP
jgi:hypothetical protein